MAAALETLQAELLQRDQELETFRRQEVGVQQADLSRPGPHLNHSQHAAADPGLRIQSHNPIGDSMAARSNATDSSVVMAEAVSVSPVATAPALIAAPADVRG